MIHRERYLYRGTTRDWPGNPVLQAQNRTPTSSDPLVAALFAIECIRHGEAVVYCARMSDAISALASPNVFAELECEFALGVAPREFIANYAFGAYPVDVVRRHLMNMGSELPAVIASRRSLDQFLKSLPRLTPGQIAEFDARML